MTLNAILSRYLDLQSDIDFLY